MSNLVFNVLNRSFPPCISSSLINSFQVDLARGLLRRIVNEKECFSWTSRVGLVCFFSLDFVS
jgi:hypothetical protein